MYKLELSQVIEMGNFRLYLDSIMRNPNDGDDNSKTVYQPNISEIDFLCPVVHQGSKKKQLLEAIKRMLVMCCCFLCKTKENVKPEDSIYASVTKPKRIYSFPELEIHNMLRSNLTEVNVQTGDSLQMVTLNKENDNIIDHKYNKTQKFNKADSFLILNNSVLKTSVIQKQKNIPDDLTITKNFNDSKSSSYTQQSNITPKIKSSNVSNMPPEEKEIQSHVYEQQNQNIVASSAGGIMLTNVDIHKENVSSIQTKHLRFEEGATMIPSDYYNDSDDIDNVNKTDRQRSVVLGTGRSWNTKNLDAIEEVHGQGSSSNRDYIRFWSKNKRSKKPQL